MGVITKTDLQTQAYQYLKSIADRLHSRYLKVRDLNGHCADELRRAIGGQCIHSWEDAVKNALDMGCPGDDVRAAWCRLKAKRLLEFYDTSIISTPRLQAVGNDRA